MGRLIVIEGVDSSGKETQAKLLYEALKKRGARCGWCLFQTMKAIFVCR